MTDKHEAGKGEGRDKASLAPTGDNQPTRAWRRLAARTRLRGSDKTTRKDMR